MNSSGKDLHEVQSSPDLNLPRCGGARFFFAIPAIGFGGHEADIKSWPLAACVCQIVSSLTQNVREKFHFHLTFVSRLVEQQTKTTESECVALGTHGGPPVFPIADSGTTVRNMHRERHGLVSFSESSLLSSSHADSDRVARHCVGHCLWRFPVDTWNSQASAMLTCLCAR